jgi:hypothetical protein
LYYYIDSIAQKCRIECFYEGDSPYQSESQKHNQNYDQRQQCRLNFWKDLNESCAIVDNEEVK